MNIAAALLPFILGLRSSQYSLRLVFLFCAFWKLRLPVISRLARTFPRVDRSELARSYHKVAREEVLSTYILFIQTSFFRGERGGRIPVLLLKLFPRRPYSIQPCKSKSQQPHQSLLPLLSRSAESEVNSFFSRFSCLFLFHSSTNAKLPLSWPSRVGRGIGLGPIDLLKFF